MANAWEIIGRNMAPQNQLVSKAPDFNSPEGLQNYMASLGVGQIQQAPQQGRVSPPPPDTTSPRNIREATGGDQLESLEKELYNLSRGGISNMEAGVSDYENMIKQYADKPTGIDLSPLAGLVDSWTGSKLSQTYKPPQTQEQRDKDLMALRLALQKQKENVTGEKISLLKSMLQGKKDKRDAGRQERFEQGQARLLDKDIRSFYETATKDMSNVGSQFSNLERAFNAKNKDGKADYAKVQAALSKFARFINDERGALTENDVGRTLLKTFDNELARFKAFWTGESTISGPQLESIKEIISNSKELTMKKYKNELDKTKKDLVGTIYESRPAAEQMYNNRLETFSSAFNSQSPESVESKSGPDSPAINFKDMTDAQLSELYKKEFGG